MDKIAALIFVGISAVLVACSGDDDEGNEGTSAAALSLVDACNAELICAFGEDAATSKLTKDAEGCHLGKVKLVPGGSATFSDGSSATWTSTTTSMSLCIGSDCAQCYPTKASAAPPSAAPAGKCTGYVSCSGFQAGSCGRHDGCAMRSHIHFKPTGGSELEYECEGTAKSCDEYTSEDGCESQGCRWE